MIPVDWDILSVWRAGKTPNSKGEALLEDVRTESDLKSKHVCFHACSELGYLRRVVCRPTFSC